MSLIIQMHGLPGSGKSTLARAIAPHIGAIVLDKDVIKAALLRAGVSEKQAAPAAYEVYFSQAEELASLGHSVILDNPVFWPIVEQRWKDICERVGAPRIILECVISDTEEYARRLRTRGGLESQLATPADVDRALAAAQQAAPGYQLSGDRLVVDTSLPVEESAARALAYIDAGVSP
jgi:predicted kinase